MVTIKFASGDMLLEGEAEDGLYKLPIQLNQVESKIYAIAKIWHSCLENLNKKMMTRFNKWDLNKVSDVKNINNNCDLCCNAKFHELPHFSRSDFERSLRACFCRCMGTSPLNVDRLIQILQNFMDATMIFNQIYLLKNKSVVVDCFINFVVWQRNKSVSS